MRSATRTRRGGAVAFQGRDGVDVVDDAHVSVAHQPAARLAPIPAEPDHADLHRGACGHTVLSSWVHLCRRGARPFGWLGGSRVGVGRLGSLIGAAVVTVRGRPSCDTDNGSPSRSRYVVASGVIST